MATLCSRGPVRERPSLRVVAFRMYPDSAAIIRLHPGDGEKSIVNIHLTPAEADRLAEALTRSRSK